MGFQLVTAYIFNNTGHVIGNWDWSQSLLWGQEDDSVSEDDDEVVVRAQHNMSPLSDTVVGTSQEFRCTACLCLQYNYNAVKSPVHANH